MEIGNIRLARLRCPLTHPALESERTSSALHEFFRLGPTAVIGTHSRNETLRNVCAFPASVGLDARELHHLAPFLRFVGDELAETGGRAGKPASPQIGEPRFDFEIAE